VNKPRHQRFIYFVFLILSSLSLLNWVNIVNMDCGVGTGRNDKSSAFKPFLKIKFARNSQNLQSCGPKQSWIFKTLMIFPDKFTQFYSFKHYQAWVWGNKREDIVQSGMWSWCIWDKMVFENIKILFFANFLWDFIKNYHFNCKRWKWTIRQIYILWCILQLYL